MDAERGLVRVKFLEEDIVSNPLQVLVPGSKMDKYSLPFSINEQVACAMDDNLEFGVVMGAVYSDSDTPPGSSSINSIDIVLGANKVQIKIDKEAGNLTLQVDGDVNIKCNKAIIEASDTNIDGDLNVTGMIKATGEIMSSVDVKGGNDLFDSTFTYFQRFRKPNQPTAAVKLNKWKT